MARQGERRGSIQAGAADLTDLYTAQALHFLKHVEAVGGRVLVHCIAGVSRSVSIVVLHLMANHGICLKQALKHIRRYRAYIQPNEGFRYELAVAEVNVSLL